MILSESDMFLLYAADWDWGWGGGGGGGGKLVIRCVKIYFLVGIFVEVISSPIIPLKKY